ncbi:IclR family transcriptional regulator [Variovorax sp. HJSM1_2]|uniref:IclR family transcriptional regulator n=1 Tax=Variovorax sp. HJSM1_2 TaxID=3366263 RepID=UPI003BEA8787
MSTLERSFGLLEYLATRPAGANLAVIAKDLALPLSATHRLLAELARIGYVRQSRDHGSYALTTKLAAMGLSFLSNSGIVDIAQPLIDRVADVAGELARLAIVDGDRLTFVAKAQGARFGLRYDPDTGIDVCLSCSAAGHAWLMTMSDEQAIEIVARAGFGDPKDYGRNAPTTIKALTKILQATRKRGFSMISEMYAPGMASMGAPVQLPGEPAIGVLTLAGPLIRMTEERMLALGPELVATARELAVASIASPMFGRAALRNAA